MKEPIYSKDLENNLFEVRLSKSLILEILFVDFREPLPGYPMEGGADVFTKACQVNTKLIDIKTSPKEDLIKKLEDDYISKITPLALKHRESSLKDKFDINIEKLNNLEKIEEKKKYLFSKLHNAKYFIATSGRMGSAEYFCLNQKTHDLLNLGDFNDFDLIGNFHINNSIEDNIILCGRKNSLSLPGVSLVILENYTEKEKKQVFSEIDPYGEEDWNDDAEILKCIDCEYQENKMSVKYNFVDVGFYPERQFYMIKVKWL